MKEGLRFESLRRKLAFRFWVIELQAWGKIFISDIYWAPNSRIYFQVQFHFKPEALILVKR